ncbi:MAG: dolichol-phosphate mannosyltransferase [Acidobacteria bacterium]|nr:MAG: dolichol-phosphate mannosyltransferase [Acidobacteriota bacterium]
MTAPGAVRVVLPAYNEEASIARVLERIAGALSGRPHEVIVVDDGSADRTAVIVRDMAPGRPIHLLQHPANLGLGPTLRDGLLAAARRSAAGDVVVTLDADDTQPPEIIPGMASMIADGYDVVIASRYRPGARALGVPRHRLLLSRSASWLFRLVLPIRGVRDFTCGFRAYRAEALKAALGDHGAGFFDQQGFQAMVDVLLKLRGRGLRFGEVPLVLRYDEKGSASKMNVWRTTWQTLLLLLRRRLG